MTLDAKLQAGAVKIEAKPKGGPKRRLKREATRLTFDIDESMPVGPQLRDALSKNAVRVIDLFRDWDDDQSGNVSKKEFRKARGSQMAITSQSDSNQVSLRTTGDG